jgi:hypothetical protein
MKHSQTPWKRGTASNNIIITATTATEANGDYEIQIHGGEGDEPIEEDMDFIIRAVNLHDDLLDVSHGVIDADRHEDRDLPTVEEWRTLVKWAKASIVKASGW